MEAATKASRRGRPARRKKQTNLRYFRNLHGDTQQDLAEFLDVTQPVISLAEHTVSALNGDRWDRLADRYNIDPRILKGRKKISAEV